MAKVLLNGNRVHLRGLVESDREQLHAWRNSPELKRLTGPGPFVPVPLDAVAIDDTERTIQFAICRNDTSLLIGWIALTNIFWSNQCAELSIYIANQGERGSGYGGDAISELLRYGFDELNLHRIEL